MKKFLITGIDSGLGKYLLLNLPNSDGLDRTNFNSIKNNDYDCIVHCAFNKENTISDYKKYISDNILLTLDLKKIKHNKFIYLSSVDVYSDNNNLYTLFKKFSESLLEEKDLILRCSALLGPTMKTNHVVKLKQNVKSLTLTKNSTFNYILYSDILEFLSSNDYESYSGVIDFVSNSFLKLEDTVKFFGASIDYGNYEYGCVHKYNNPIFNLSEKYNKSSIEVLREYNGQ